MGFPIVVAASVHSEDTWLGTFLTYGSWYAFPLVWLLVINAMLVSVGLPNDHRPPALLVLLIILGFVPAVLVLYTYKRPRIARQLRLIRALPAKANMDLRGLGLTLDGIERPWIPWDRVESLERSGRDWQLVGTDGSPLVLIPRSLMWPAPTWNDAPSFAELVVQLRADRFALRGERYEPGMTEFAMRRPDDIVGRPRQVVQKRVLAIGVVLAILAFALLIAITPTR